MALADVFVQSHSFVCLSSIIMHSNVPRQETRMAFARKFIDILDEKLDFPISLKREHKSKKYGDLCLIISLTKALNVIGEIDCSDKDSLEYHVREVLYSLPMNIHIEVAKLIMSVHEKRQ